jgi:predicted ferric reductase
MGLFKKKKIEGKIPKVNEESGIPPEQPKEEKPVFKKDVHSTHAGLGNVSTELEKLMLNQEALQKAFHETRITLTEKLSSIGEQVGDIRKRIAGEDEIIEENEPQPIKASDFAESEEPENLMLEVQKQDAKIEALKANLEGNEEVMTKVMDDFTAMKKKIEDGKVEEISRKTEGDLNEIKKLEEAIIRRENNIQKIYSELKSKLQILDNYDTRIETIAASLEQNSKDLNLLKTKVFILAQKEEPKKLKYLGTKKFLLVAVIILTSVTPAFFIQLNEATALLNIYKLLAKIGSLIGLSLFCWQFLIGFRQAAPYLITDFVWSLDLHKQLGKIASILILLHPVFISLFYLEREGINPLTISIVTEFDAYVMLGQIALIVIAIIFITSVLIRKYMSFDVWYYIHLISYLLIPAAFIHSFPIGTTLQNTSLIYIWIVMASIITVFYIYRFLCRLMLFSKKYKVIDTHEVAPETTEIKSFPQEKHIQPKLTQFIFFRRGFWKTARPYTVSDYDEITHELSITAKAMGRTSTALQSIQPGKAVYIDGPYGVFALGILHSRRPVIMVAGGIGITPFRRVWKKLKDIPGKKFYLFYGNQNEDEIVYKNELHNTPNIEIVHVMSDQPDYQGEKGYITPELIKKYVQDDLSDHEFFICGPPTMILKLEEQLHSENIDPKQINHELFDY